MHFKSAADAGHPDAAFELAICYENGEGAKKNPSKAASYYLRAYLLGRPDGAIEVSRLFYWGIGVQRNRALASEIRKLKDVLPGRSNGAK